MKNVISQKRLILAGSLMAAFLVPQTSGDTILLASPRIDITTDVGYYLSIDNTDPIQLTSNNQSPDPLHTFKGCGTYTFESNFVAQITTTIVATSIAGGTWSITTTPNIADIGFTEVSICINVENLDIIKLPGGVQGLKIAELTIMVSPSLFP